MRKVKIVQNDENDVPIEILAQSIKSISDGIKKLRQGPLTDKCLILLIQHAAPTISGQYGKISRLGTNEVRAVLEGMESLESVYLKKKSERGEKGA